jgi:hypothetical protein
LSTISLPKTQVSPFTQTDFRGQVRFREPMLYDAGCVETLPHGVDDIAWLHAIPDRD